MINVSRRITAYIRKKINVYEVFWLDKYMGDAFMSDALWNFLSKLCEYANIKYSLLLTK